MSKAAALLSEYRSPQKKRKRFDPHRFVGDLVIYCLALDGAVRFLHWLATSLIHEFAR